VILISHDRDFLDRIGNAVIVPEGGGRWQEYAGGYSDMLAQRGADLAARPVTKPAPSMAAGNRRPPRDAPPAKRRLKFHEKHALETLPKRIRELKDTIRELQKRFDDADLYSRDPAAFAKVSDALVATQAELAEAEENWLELEILREEIEGG
jgi:ATP-binding cassette subfamily F protein uup